MDLLTLFEGPAFSSALGILGLIAAVFFYLRGKQEKKLVFVNKENVVIGDDKNVPAEKLKVTFDGVDVARVTRSAFAFWNAGRRTIRKGDIAGGDPLRIEVPLGARILATSVDRSTRDANNIALSVCENGQMVLIEFDFLDFRDGANISVVHSAASGKWTFSGTILGMPAGVKNWGPALIDIESFRTPRPSRSWYRRVAEHIICRLFKWSLFIAPSIILLSAIFTRPMLALFPSLGKPDTTGMLIPGKINLFWGSIGLLFLSVELIVLIWMLHVPPKKLMTRRIVDSDHSTSEG